MCQGQFPISRGKYTFLQPFSVLVEYTSSTHPYSDDCKEINQCKCIMALRTQTRWHGPALYWFHQSCMSNTQERTICTVVVVIPVADGAASDSEPTEVYLQFSGL